MLRRGLLGRMLHKRELTRVPKPCQNSSLPPWIAMQSSCVPNRAANKRSKASRTKSKDAGAQLRGLRGAYLGYHSKEQAKIPLMASQLDVAAVNQQVNRNYYEVTSDLVPVVLRSARIGSMED